LLTDYLLDEVLSRLDPILRDIAATLISINPESAPR
jgi:hypothetical protein